MKTSYKLPPHALDSLLKSFLGITLAIWIALDISDRYDQPELPPPPQIPAWASIPKAARLYPSGVSEETINKIFQQSLDSLSSASLTYFSMKQVPLKSTGIFQHYNPKQKITQVQINLECNYANFVTLLSSLQQQHLQILWETCFYDATNYPTNHAELSFYIV